MKNLVFSFLTAVLFLSILSNVHAEVSSPSVLTKVKMSLWNQGTRSMGETELMMNSPFELSRLPIAIDKRSTFKSTMEQLPDELQVPLKKSFFMDS